MKSQITLTSGLFAQILLIATLGQIGADLYLPSLPNIAHDFNASSSDVELTFAAYLFGFSISHLFYGPVSDRIGRRLPILFGIGLSFIGCLVCLFSPSILILILGRFLQGSGVGACSSVGRSLGRDFLSGAELAKVGSHLSMIGAFVLASAPMLGGYIEHYFSWRTAFLFLSLYTLISWTILLKALPETHHHRNVNATHFNVAIKNYFTLLTHKVFLGYTLGSSLAYAGLLGYFTAAPFIFQNLLDLTPVEFGWLSFCTASAIALSGFINGRYVIHYGISKMMLLGISGMVIGSIGLMLLSLTTQVSIISLVAPMMIFAFGSGISFQNAFAGAFHPFPHMAGAAGALYGCAQVLGGGLASAIVASLHISDPFSLSCLLVAIAVMAVFARRLTLENS